MGDRNRTIFAILIAVIIVLAIFGSFAINLFSSTAKVQLADVSSQQVTDTPAEGESGMVQVDVTPKTVQSVISSLTRYNSYTRTVSVSYFWGEEGTGSVTSQVSVDGGWTRADTTLSDGSVEHSIVGNDKLYLWYGSQTAVRSGPAEKMEDDLVQRIPTYEDVLDLDPGSITGAGYQDKGGVPCIYVETKENDLGYTERYWISVESGLLVASETEKGGELVYRMSSYEVATPVSVTALFALPDGTVLHASSAS